YLTPGVRVMAREAAATAPTVDIPTQSIRLPKDRPKLTWDPKDEKDYFLIESIRKLGILQAIQVREVDGGSKPYELVFGKRGLAPARSLGLETIPARVAKVTDDQMALLAMTENTMRRSMSYAEYLKRMKVVLREWERLFGPDPGKANNNAAWREK